MKIGIIYAKAHTHTHKLHSKNGMITKGHNEPQQNEVKKTHIFMVPKI